MSIKLRATLPRLTTPVQVLQVFNNGQLCGWLGEHSKGYWFHYNSTSPHQPWVSLLMPPQQNFYSCKTLFPVFEQHLPQSALLQTLQAHFPERTLTTLDLLSVIGQHSLGGLGFSNPDLPVVKPRITFPPTLLQTLPFEEIASQYLPHGLGVSGTSPRLLIQTQRQFNVPDSIAYQHLPLQLINMLGQIKQNVDPDNTLHALRWIKHFQAGTHLCHHPRPDFNPQTQQRNGMEHLRVLANLSLGRHIELQNQHQAYDRLVHETIRTYSRHSAREIKLWKAVRQTLPAHAVEPFWIYSHSNPSNPEKPLVLGFDLLPA